MAMHRYNKNTTSKQIIDLGDAFILLVELYPCNSKDELNRREGEFILNNECINKRVAGNTKKEYYTQNKDIIIKKSKEYYQQIKEQYKLYYLNNAEELKKKSRERYQKSKII